MRDELMTRLYCAILELNKSENIICQWVRQVCPSSNILLVCF